jgi:hypothetical protein
MRNALFVMFAVLFCISCGAADVCSTSSTMPAPAPETPNAQNEVPSLGTSSTTLPTIIRDLRLAGWQRARCVIVLDLETGDNGVNCREVVPDVQPETPATRNDLPSLGTSDTALNTIIRDLRLVGWQHAMCIVMLDLETGHGDVNCQEIVSDGDDDSGEPAEPDPATP